MLAVHWSPVSNTKTILKNGIKKSKTGLYCFPLTGHKMVDLWWVNQFNQSFSRRRKKYHGFVFRLEEDDFPAYFGDWLGATIQDTFKKEIPDLATLGKQYRETLIWRMGESIAHSQNLSHRIYDPDAKAQLFKRLAEEELAHNKQSLSQWTGSANSMEYTLEHQQIVLSHSITANRIIKVLPQHDEFGRVLRIKKEQKDFNSDFE